MIVSEMTYDMASSSKYSGSFIIETIHSIEVNDTLVAFALIKNSNYTFRKTNMVEIYNFSILLDRWFEGKSLIYSPGVTVLSVRQCLVTQGSLASRGQ